MKVTTTDDVLDYFEKHQPKALPTTKEIYTPNYSIYGVLPLWKVSQAVCLLAGVATMDSETYYTLKSFNWLHEKIRISLETKSQGHNADYYQSFSNNYVAFEFPIKARTITLLRNLSSLLNEAIKKGEIVCRRVKTNTSFDDLLVPDDVIAWAEKKTIIIPDELSKAMLQEKAPCVLAAFKRTTWSLDEAVLIYHNIDRALFDEVIQSSSSFFLCRHIVLLLDKEERIFENFQNYTSIQSLCSR